MYAVIKTGGKQYKVVAGKKYKVEQIPADIGSEITLDQVLAVGEGESIRFGTPLVEGAQVQATVVAQGRHKKVKIFRNVRGIVRITLNCKSFPSTLEHLPARFLRIGHKAIHSGVLKWHTKKAAVPPVTVVNRNRNGWV